MKVNKVATAKRVKTREVGEDYLKKLQGGIKTDHHRVFQSIESFFAYDRKWKHEQATKAVDIFGSYDSAMFAISHKRIEVFASRGEGVDVAELAIENSEIETYFTRKMSVLTVLDQKGSSCNVIEVTLDSIVWNVDIGYPAHHAWWEFDTLREALEFAVEQALEINFAEDPKEKLRVISSGN